MAAITAQRLASGLSTPTADTGDDCRARAKLSEAALGELTVEIAEELEEQAEAKWLWKGRHAKLVDGFTWTMPDIQSASLFKTALASSLSPVTTRIE